MSIKPTQFDPDGTIHVLHTERGHSGTVTLADVRFATRPDGTEDQRFLRLACPVSGCDSESLHPVGGGADPEMVQALHVLKRQQTDRRGKKFSTLLAEVEAAAEAEMPGRFRLTGVTPGDIQNGRGERPTAARDRRTPPKGGK